MQKRSVGTDYVLEKLPDVSGPGLVEAGRYRFDPTAQIHLRGLYKQGLSTPGEEEKSLSEEAIKVRVLELLSHRELELATS